MILLHSPLHNLVSNADVNVVNCYHIKDIKLKLFVMFILYFAC